MDFKEVKFHLNIYNDEHHRRAYGRYLCRRAGQEGSKSPAFIIYELHHRDLLPRAEALEKGTHRAQYEYKQTIQAVDCAWVRPRLKR